MKKVTVYLSNEDNKEVFSKQLTEEITDLVRSYLEEINEEIIAYNGSVEAIQTSSGNFRFVAVCDHETVRYEMQDLLPKVYIPTAK